MLSIILAYIKILSLYFCCDMTMSLTLFLFIKRFGYQEKKTIVSSLFINNDLDAFMKFSYS